MNICLIYEHENFNVSMSFIKYKNFFIFIYLTITYPMIGPTAPGFSWLLAHLSEMLVRVTLMTLGVPGGAG